MMNGQKASSLRGWCFLYADARMTSPFSWLVAGSIPAIGTYAPNRQGVYKKAENLPTIKAYKEWRQADDTAHKNGCREKTRWSF